MECPVCGAQMTLEEDDECITVITCHLCLFQIVDIGDGEEQ